MVVLKRMVRCFHDVKWPPEKRVRAMQRYCERDVLHWVHKVKADRVSDVAYLVSWNNRANRRYMNFDELEDNGTRKGTFAYSNENFHNKFSDNERAKRQRR